MDYSTAKAIRGRSLSSMITQNIRAGGGVGSSIKRSISQKMRAKGVGIKEKFDPLNIVKFLTGGSNLGPAIFGRLTGRKQSDINYFSGGRKTATQIGRSGAFGKIQNTPTDSISTLFTFIRQSYEQDLKMRETERTFQEEKSNEEQRRHNEFLKALKAYTSGTASMVKTEKEGGGLLGFINSLFEKFKKEITSLVDSINFLKNASVLKVLTGLLINPISAAVIATLVAAYGLKKLEEATPNYSVLTPKEAQALLENGSAVDIEKAGGYETLANIVKNRPAEAQKALDDFKAGKITEAELNKMGGEKRLMEMVEQTGLTVPEKKELPDTVVPRPKARGIKQTQWDSLYGNLYNPDGTKKLQNEMQSTPQQQFRRSEIQEQNMTPQPMNAATLSPVGATPPSAPVYDSSSENADLNMMGNVGNGAPATPIVTNSVNNSSTEQPMPATASIRDSTDVLSRVMNQSAAYV